MSRKRKQAASSSGPVGIPIDAPPLFLPDNTLKAREIVDRFNTTQREQVREVVHERAVHLCRDFRDQCNSGLTYQMTIVNSSLKMKEDTFARRVASECAGKGKVPSVMAIHDLSELDLQSTALRFDHEGCRKAEADAIFDVSDEVRAVDREMFISIRRALLTAASKYEALAVKFAAPKAIVKPEPIVKSEKSDTV